KLEAGECKTDVAGIRSFGRAGLGRIERECQCAVGRFVAHKLVPQLPAYLQGVAPVNPAHGVVKDVGCADIVAAPLVANVRLSDAIHAAIKPDDREIASSCLAKAEL